MGFIKRLLGKKPKTSLRLIDMPLVRSKRRIRIVGFNIQQDTFKHKIPPANFLSRKEAFILETAFNGGCFYFYNEIVANNNACHCHGIKVAVCKNPLFTDYVKLSEFALLGARFWKEPNNLLVRLQLKTFL